MQRLSRVADHHRVTPHGRISVQVNQCHFVALWHRFAQLQAPTRAAFRQSGACRQATGVGDDGGGKAVKHTDCASCHAGAAATLPLPVAGLSSAPRDGVGEQPPPRYRSHTPSGPERPDIV